MNARSMIGPMIAGVGTPSSLRHSNTIMPRNYYQGLAVEMRKW